MGFILELNMFLRKFSSLLSLIALFTGSSLPIMANPVSRSHTCDEAGSTGLTYQCLQNELKQLDNQLKELLYKVPATASESPQQFRDLWMEHLEREGLNRSNVSQLMEFQKARRNYCLYVNSIAFQGTGYDLMVLKCEIELTQSALKNEI